jgi:hypothetical protein
MLKLALASTTGSPSRIAPAALMLALALTFGPVPGQAAVSAPPGQRAAHPPSRHFRLRGR